MKVTVIPSPRNSKEFTVELQQGAQYFRMDYSGSKSECRWMAKMFRIALKNHLLEASKPAPRITKPRKPKATTPEDIDRQFSSLNSSLNKVS